MFGLTARKPAASRRQSRSAAPPPPERRLPVEADASYLVVGGLGGLGAQTARWLAENGALHVNRLVVGSVVMSARSIRVPALVGGLLDRADIEIEPVVVARLEGEDADPGTIVYNLLLDGDHTYIANGYLVHNKTSSH